MNTFSTLYLWTYLSNSKKQWWWEAEKHEQVFSTDEWKEVTRKNLKVKYQSQKLNMRVTGLCLRRVQDYPYCSSNILFLQHKWYSPCTVDQLWTTSLGNSLINEGNTLRDLLMCHFLSSFTYTFWILRWDSNLNALHLPWCGSLSL